MFKRIQDVTQDDILYVTSNRYCMTSEHVPLCQPNMRKDCWVKPSCSNICVSIQITWSETLDFCLKSDTFRHPELVCRSKFAISRLAKNGILHFYDISLCISPRRVDHLRRVAYLAYIDILFILEVFMEVPDTYAKSTG